MVYFFEYMKMLKHPVSHQAFSLVEFIVIISIFAVMAGVGLFNFRGFQSDVSVSNLAHDLALTLHQAQVGGIAGVSTSILSQPVGVPIGFEIKYDNGSQAFEHSFILFENPTLTFDYYEADPANRLLDTITIQSQDTISSIETSDDNGLTWTPYQNTVVVYFQRPFPEPTFLNLGGATLLRFTITNPDQTVKKSVIISKIGQIRIE